MAVYDQVREVIAYAAFAIAVLNAFRAARGLATGEVLYGRRRYRARPVKRDVDPGRFWIQVASLIVAAVGATGIGTWILATQP